MEETITQSQKSLQEGTVPSEIKNAQSAAAELHELISALENKLSPILHKDISKALAGISNEVASPDQPIRTELAQEAHLVVSDVRSAAVRVRSLLKTLGL